MTSPTSDPASAPASSPPWQDPRLFPAAPLEAPCGVLGPAGPLPGHDSDDLVVRLRRDAARAIALAWTPASDRLVPVGEVPGLAAPLAERDLPYWLSEQRTGRVLGLGAGAGLLIAAAFAPPLAILPLFLALQGLAQGLAARGALRTLADPLAYAREQALALRFAAWSGARRWRGTQALVGLLIALAVLVTVSGETAALHRLGLDPKAIRQGEWSRLASAGLVHFGPLHLMLNLLALVSLGRLVEALAGWRGMLLAFAVGVLGGNALSALFALAPLSAGASSGICGLLGWLLIAAQPRPGGVPATLRAAVVRNVYLVALLGVVGASVVDHAAHVGGLVAGAILAALDGRRLPGAGTVTRVGGWIAAGALLATAALIVRQLQPLWA